MTVLIDQIISDLKNNVNQNDVKEFFNGCPKGIPKSVLEKGVVVVEPQRTIIKPITTGIRDEETSAIKVILLKSVQDEFVKNPTKESGMQYLMRVLDGRNADLSPQSNTIRYIVRQNLKKWGLNQPTININYNTKENISNAEGCIFGNITITYVNIFNQILN